MCVPCDLLADIDGWFIAMELLRVSLEEFDARAAGVGWLSAFAAMPVLAPVPDVDAVVFVRLESSLLEYDELGAVLLDAVEVPLDLLAFVSDLVSDLASSWPATPPIAPPATAPTGPPTTAPPTAPDAAPTVVAWPVFVMLSHVEHPASATIASAMALLLNIADVMKISFRDRRRAALCGLVQDDAAEASSRLVPASATPAKLMIGAGRS
jgi:hypothetical protein